MPHLPGAPSRQRRVLRIICSCIGEPLQPCAQQPSIAGNLRKFLVVQLFVVGMGGQVAMIDHDKSKASFFLGKQAILQTGTDNGFGRCQFDAKAVEKDSLRRFPGRLECVFKALELASRTIFSAG